MSPMAQTRRLPLVALLASFVFLWYRHHVDAWVAGKRIGHGRSAWGRGLVSRHANAREGFGNPYDLLGLQQGADVDEVRPAFKKLAASLHPDVPGTGDDITFRKVLWAYQELSDPARRLRWSVKSQRRQRRRAGGAPASGVTFRSGSTEFEYLDVEDLLEDEDWAVPTNRGVDEWDVFFAAMEEEAQREEEERRAQEPARRREARDVEKEIRAKMERETEAMRQFIEGSYIAVGENHGRPVFRRQNERNPTMVYFWDDRDGREFVGWWIGPSVGAERVWAYNPDWVSETLPQSRWRVPWRGPIEDSMKVTFDTEEAFRINFERTTA